MPQHNCKILPTKLHALPIAFASVGAPYWGVLPCKNALPDSVCSLLMQLHRRWAPKWVEVQVIAYSGIRPVFSLLWADPGRHWRHIMDFKAMQLSQRPPLSEML